MFIRQLSIFLVILYPVIADVITDPPWFSHSLSEQQQEAYDHLDRLNSTEKYALAQELIRAHRYNEAVVLLKETSLGGQLRGLAQLQLGYVYSWQENYVEASRAFARALATRACNKEAVEGLKGVAVELCQEPASFKDAIDAYMLLLRCEPENSDYYFRIGQLYAWTNQWDKAEEALKKALDLDPGNGDAEVQLGILYYWQKKYQRASDLLYYYPRNPEANGIYLEIQSIFDSRASAKGVITLPLEGVLISLDQEKQIAIEEEILDRDPADADAYVRLGRLYLLTGQNELGRQVLIKALDYDPNLTQALIQLGFIYLWEQDYSKADTYFEEASRFETCDTQLNEGLFQVALHYEQVGQRLDRLAEIYRQLLRCHPSDPRYYMHYGRVLSWQGDTAEARLFLRRSLRRDPSCIDCILQIGVIEFWEKEYEKSWAIFSGFSRVPQAQIFIQRQRLATENFLTLKEFKEQPVLIVKPMTLDQHEDYSAQIKAFRKNEAMKFPRDERWLYLSQMYIVNGQLDAARKLLGQLVKKFPNMLKARLQYGYVLLWQNDLDGAYKQFDCAVKRGACDFSATVGLEEVARELAFNSENIPRVVEIYRTIINCRGEYADDYYNYGRYLAWNGQWDKAEEVLKKAISTDPLHIEAHEQLGKLYMWQMRLDEAEEMFQRFPKSAGSQHGFDRIQFLKSDFLNTMRVQLSQVIVTPPTSFEYGPLYLREARDYKHQNPDYAQDSKKLFILAQLYLLAGKWKYAISLLQEAYRINPEDVNPIVQMGYIRLWKHKWESAYALFKEALEHQPCDAMALDGYKAIGEVWSKRKPTFRSALKIYRTLHDCQPRDPGYLVAMGRLYAFTGNQKLGRKYVEEALEIDPYNFGAEMQMGTFHLWAGHYQEAEEIFARYPHRPFAILMLARVKMAEKKYRLAEMILLRGLEQFPDESEMQFLLVQVYRKELKYHKALQLLNKLTDAHTGDERFWNDAWIVKGRVRPSISGRGSFTYSKEGDPDAQKEWVVRTAYKNATMEFMLPLNDRLRIYASPSYYTERELSITNPGTVNYNNYERSVKFGGDLIIVPQVDLSASVRFTNPGQIGTNTVFPLNTAPNPTQVQPSVATRITIDHFSFHADYMQTAFFIKNFNENVSQLLGIREVGGGGAVTIPNWPRFKAKTDWSVTYYDTTLNNVPNHMIHRSVDVEIGVPFLSDYILASYGYEYESFARISRNYNSFKRRQKNYMAFDYAWTYNWTWTLGFGYRREWKSSLGESTPLGTTDIITATNKTQSNRFNGFFDFRIRDRLSGRYEMTWFESTFPYQYESFKVRLEYRF